VRRCLDCSDLCERTRCQDCTRARKRIRNADRPTARAQVERVPYCECAGCNVCTGRPCSSSDLTADHVVSYVNGGTNDGRRKTLCRKCNSAKRDRT
jgi:5-methylcytosine-specific restriction endonuclease McrA